MGFKVDIADNKEQSRQSGLSELLQKEVRLWGSLFGSKRKEAFYGELSVLLKAGVNLKDALILIRDNQRKEKIKEYLDSIVSAIVSGSSLHDALRAKSDFTPYEIQSLKIGEASGTLSEVVEELGKFFERKNTQRRMVANALAYPVIILVTAVLVVVFMLRMIVPMFEDIFNQNGMDLPPITRMVVGASNLISDYGWLLLVLLALMVAAARYFKEDLFYRRNRDRILLRLPIAGKFIRTVYLAQFTQAITLLTRSHVPVLNGLRMIREMIRFVPLEEALASVEEQVLRGTPLHKSMEGHEAILDHKMIALVKVAEETNQTEYIFEKLRQQYHAEVEQRSKLLSTLLEPLIIVIVGIFVGVILVSMYLPMFKLSSVLG